MEVDIDQFQIIDKIIEVDCKTIMEMTVGETITGVKIIEIEVEVKTMQRHVQR